MRILASLVAVIGTLSLVAGCGGKPCDPIPPSATAKQLGFILQGGVLCKEDRNVATVDYPNVEGDAIGKVHKDALGKAGWSVDAADDGVFLATKASNTLFIVTAKASSERKVPFAVVRYCQNETCRRELTGLSDAMKKLKKK